MAAPGTGASTKHWEVSKTVEQSHANGGFLQTSRWCLLGSFEASPCSNEVEESQQRNRAPENNTERHCGADGHHTGDDSCGESRIFLLWFLLWLETRRCQTTTKGKGTSACHLSALTRPRDIKFFLKRTAHLDTGFYKVLLFINRLNDFFYIIGNNCFCKM